MTAEISRPALWVGRFFSGSVGILLLLDAVMKFVKPAQVVDATLALGLTESTILPLGVVLLLSTLLYLVPRTSFIGAILLTGYLGGVVCIHLRNAHGPFELSLPVVFGILLWAGLYLRNPDLRRLVA
ncbi:MAG: DoxX family protein [Deltaproteobacteria bacterium]|nr:DoxX family protein [Deltaproteobacteria bacterium]